MTMPKQENTKIDRAVLDKQAEYVAAKYKQIKLAIPNEEAEAVQDYCKRHGLKVATLIRELIKEELKSGTRAEDGVGRVAKKMIR